METSAVPLLAEKQHSGYNNCFVLGGKVETTGKNGEKGYKKIRVYIDEEDKVQCPAFSAGSLNVSELARVCNLSRTTVYKYIGMMNGGRSA